ncbi:LysR family transcriptional regulator [Massilia arenosa]|uniref:LysR family transcriptional regulator n=1 Tax=Zemynaea arenosa TaxID=2561931 RepID=A0A4Y9RSS9_9BURK|nr:LysR family transcriptional regulator [Massilia arenosa]TFW11351.1 LysR family transcriptional regulator [Massilia arenosa]
MDKLRSMEVFVAVVEDGSFAAAARRFDISAVMVGKHVEHLERLLDARLLTRTTRRQKLTEIGEQYLEQCRSILAQVEEAESGAHAMRAWPRGTLRVSAGVQFGSEYLAPALVDYLEQHPDVSLDLDLSDRIVDIVDEGFDAAIRIGPLNDSDLVARRLQDYGLMIAASPAYLKKHGKPQHPRDLVHHQCLDFTHWHKNIRWRLRGMDDLEIPAYRMRSNSGRALKNAALAGFGIIMQAEMLLREEVKRHELVPLLQAWLPEPRPMHIVYPHDRRATPKLTTFVNFVLARFGKL